MEILELSIWTFKTHWMGLKISVEKENELEYRSIEIVNLKEKRGKRWHRKKDKSQGSMRQYQNVYYMGNWSPGRRKRKWDRKVYI